MPELEKALLQNSKARQEGHNGAPLVHAWTWSQDVLAFGKQTGVSRYLEAFLSATRALFPAARALRVKIETDPEIPDDQHIVWEVDVPFNGTSEYLKSQRRWIEALSGVCPAPLTCVFRLLLMPVSRESA